MEFLDGFKPVDPANRLREWKQRTVAWASGALAAGSHVELCLTEHPHKEPVRPQSTDEQLFRVDL